MDGSLDALPIRRDTSQPFGVVPKLGTPSGSEARHPPQMSRLGLGPPERVRSAPPLPAPPPGGGTAQEMRVNPPPSPLLPLLPTGADASLMPAFGSVQTAVGPSDSAFAARRLS